MSMNVSSNVPPVSSLLQSGAQPAAVQRREPTPSPAPSQTPPPAESNPNQVNTGLIQQPDDPNAQAVSTQPSQVKFSSVAVPLQQVREGKAEIGPGQHGEPVFKLGGLLGGLGFLLAGAPSRSFTPALEKAVKDFQEARGEKPTGKVDQKTMQQIDTAAASKGLQEEQNPPPPDQVTSTPTPPQGNAQSQYPFVGRETPQGE